MNDTNKKNNRVCYGDALRKAARRVSNFYSLVLAPCGLKQTQHSLLAYIDRAGGLTITQLASDMLLERSALSRNLKPLTRDGLVSINFDEEDNRMRRVTLTPAGKAKLVESKRLWQHANDKFERIYGKDKAALLRGLLADVLSEEIVSAFELDR